MTSELTTALANATLQDDEVAQLSSDLALFLQNPSLRTALADGSLDLTSYSDEVHDEWQALEATCLKVYREQSKEIEALQTDVNECRAVLRQWHEVLLGFQADLGGLSLEIRQLQEKSRTLDVQLQNRQAAEAGLRQFLERLVVAPALAQTITTGRVNPTFLQACQELQEMYRNAHATHPQEWSRGQVPSETVSGQELQVQLQKLRWLAVSRVRDYFLQQLALLRKPQTNVRMIQVHGLLKYAGLQDFLKEACPEIATEIFNVYCESLSGTLQQLFRTYQAQLLQLDATKSTRQDVLAMDDALLRDSLTTRAKKRTDVFCLGTRATDCLEADSTPIHVALAENKKYPYERLFRSLVGHLVDAVTNEHVVCRQFFKRDAFDLLFRPTISLLLEELENYLFSCYDAIGLLLLIKVTHSYKRLARQRRIHSLDACFFDQVTKLTWPRLKIVMEGHLRSLKQATAQKLGGVDLHAHYMSRRFGEFTCSILLILQERSAVPSPSKPSSADHTHRRASSVSLPGEMSAGEKLLQDLTELQDEFVHLLERLAEEHSSQKKKIVFTINNLDQVVSIFQERRVVGKEFNRLVELLMQQREYFVEVELLSAGFSKMIAFCQQTEAHLASRSTNPQEVVQQAQVEALVLDFASNWKGNMELINRNVLSYFSNFRNGMEILKQVLTQLLLYYTRFQDIIRKVWRNKLPPFCKDLVSTTIILAEIKKYALAI